MIKRFKNIINTVFSFMVFAMPMYLLYNHIFYYKERIINSDEGFPLYNFVEHNVVDMLHFRFAQVIYSLPPILFNVLGFDIKTIAIVYAISFSAPVFITMLILYKMSFKYFLIFILSFTFFISHQYYFPIAEYWLGSCIYFLLYMLIDSKYERVLNNKWLVIFLILIIINLHLSLFYPTLIMLIYLYLKGKLDFKSTLMYLAVCVGYLGFKFIFLTTSYESNIMTGGNKVFNNLDFYNSRIIKEFFNHGDWILLLVILLIIIYRTYQGVFNIYKSIVLITFILIPLVIISFVFYDFPYFFYVIGNLRILLLFLPIFFVDFCPKKIFKPIVILLIIYAICNIEIIGVSLKKRYDNITELLQNTNENTVYTYDDSVCLVHVKYIFMQTMTVNILENNKNNYIRFVNPKTNNVDYLNNDLLKYQSISKKEYKNTFTDYRTLKLSDTKYTIYDFLIDRNVTECLLE